VVSPKTTSPSLQGHRDAGRCRGRAGRCRGRDGRCCGCALGRCRGRGVVRCRGCDGRCRGCNVGRCRSGGIGMVQRPVPLPHLRPTRPLPMSDAWSYPVTLLDAFALSGTSCK
jgi:hypothetical protein